MLAIPVFRARVAPVFDWCSKIIIVPEDGSDAPPVRQVDVTKENAFKLVQTLREQGIKTLICGALSTEILTYGESIGLKIIHGIAGDIEEVLRAYRERKLDQPRYWLPGCREQRRYRSSGTCCDGRNARYEEEQQIPRNKAAGNRKGAGRPEGLCVCPQCGAKSRHERGIPCTQTHCPECHSVVMIRE